MPVDFFFVQSGKRFVKIFYKALLYVRANKGLTELVTSQASYFSSWEMAHFDRMLACRGFCRVHEGYLVALDRIISFDNSVVELPGAKVPIGRHYMKRLKSRVRIILDEKLDWRGLVVDERGRLKGVVNGER